MERPFSSKVIEAVYSGYSGDYFDSDAAIDAVLELLPEPTVQPTVETVARAIYDCTDLNRAVLEDAREIAEAVLAVLPGRTEAEVKAEALREAADAWYEDETAGHWAPGLGDDQSMVLHRDDDEGRAWLRDRADRIEREG